MKNIMLDLETMGTASDSAIVAIGAVKFDDLMGVYKDFYVKVDLQSCVDRGLRMDAGTVKWWMRQSDEARKEIYSNGIPLKDALSQFQEFLGNANTQIWGNGSDFDNAILINAFRKFKINSPWKFYLNRCFRTLRCSFPDIDMSDYKGGVAHNALDDAKWQATYLLRLVEKQKIKGVLK